MLEQLKQSNKIDIVCIGSPKVSGDAVGPLVGTLLSKYDYEKDVKITGTLLDPITGLTYPTKIMEVRPDAYIIAVDAFITPHPHNLWKWVWCEGAMKPGNVMNHKLHPVGNLHIKAITSYSIETLVKADYAKVEWLAEQITTGLLDLLGTTKIKRYIEI